MQNKWENDLYAHIWKFLQLLHVTPATENLLNAEWWITSATLAHKLSQKILFYKVFLSDTDSLILTHCLRRDTKPAGLSSGE